MKLRGKFHAEARIKTEEKFSYAESSLELKLGPLPLRQGYEGQERKQWYALQAAVSCKL
jgi:hypothetical protein